MGFWTWVGIALIVAIVAVGKSLDSKDPRVKGKLGELLLSGYLKTKLDSSEYSMLNNIYLPDGDATTQIDHVLVSQYGVFVIETKSYKGWIFGGDNAKWTQSLPGGKKFQFQNPMRQNYKHICTISDCTGIPKNLLIPIVAFSGEAKLMGDLREHHERFPSVHNFCDVPDYILSFKETVIKPSQVPEIVNVIKEWQASISWSVKHAHVENLRRKHER